ncbi:hypothetical protein NOU13_27685 [Rhodococcus erythropolis]|uniref:hypothetical protein n=1 Tax=Rhodococcus erythropolis TaxID=1833 RepID=UPI00210ABE3E|nr:hypothetical protein [Rhodococcus erythropolis]MCQ4128290.1 hypothetical protein [Rhodococcus erythropolis]
MFIALLTAAAFIGIYVGLQRDPIPRNIPVAVIGDDLARQVSAALGDAVAVTTVSDIEAGRNLIAGRDAVAVLYRTSSTVLFLAVAGANGPSTVGALEKLIGVYGRSSGSEVITTDVNPLTRYDSRGVVGFYVAFGVSLASFILAQMLPTSTAFVHSRHRLVATVVFAAAVGLMASLLAGPILGALPGSVVSLSITLALLSAATALATMALGAVFGAMGVPIATLLLITVGNSTSGATVGANLLPDVARLLSEMLPPGAAISAITDVSYFGGAHRWAGWSVLIAWIVFASGLIVLKNRRLSVASTREHAAS